MRLNLIAVGHKMPSWVKEAYDDYSRRLSARLPVTLIELPPGKRSSGVTPERAMADEGKRILAQLKLDSQVVALDDQGRQRTTPELSQWLAERLRDGRDLSFLIGGPDGHAPEVLARAQERWSLSKLTLPHQLVRVVFIEQIYRAVTLLDGHPYHRE
ncbi:MAG: 23S rRNA (pseudouridine(1915)-N(3))-methyltransferase RlmH [Proteobacteria bacterium]|nr:23S rRNA (pseudouridine(1915)-N(3))-methyltransferase RlmH [Pseudomonadota bacterium]